MIRQCSALAAFPEKLVPSSHTWCSQLPVTSCGEECFGAGSASDMQITANTIQARLQERLSVTPAIAQIGSKYLLRPGLSFLSFL